MKREKILRNNQNKKEGLSTDDKIKNENKQT